MCITCCKFPVTLYPECAHVIAIYSIELCGGRPPTHADCAMHAVLFTSSHHPQNSNSINTAVWTDHSAGQDCETYVYQHNY